MSVTTGNSISLTTGTVNRQFGTFSLQIDTPAVSGFSTTSIRVANMPKLKQDFDVQYEFDDLSSLRVNLSEIEVEIFDALGNKDSLFELISGLNVSDAMTIQCTVNGGTDYFYATRQSCEYDWEKRSVTITGVAALRYDVEVTDYAGIVASKIFNSSVSGSPSSYDMLLSGDLIDSFLESQGSSPTVVSRTSYFNSFIDSAGSGTTYLGFFADDTNPFTGHVDDYLDAQDTLLRMLILDGAFMGSMLGYSFYMPRAFNQEVTLDGESSFSTINADDIADYSIDNHEKNVYKYISLFGMYNPASSNNELADMETNYQVDVTINELGAKNVNLEYLMRAETLDYDGANWETNGSTIDTKLNADNTLIRDNTRKSYALSLGIADTNITTDVKYAIEMDILGIDKLKPFQFVKIGADVHPAINGVKFRPSNIEYDLEKNTIKLRAYPIG